MLIDQCGVFLGPVRMQLGFGEGQVVDEDAGVAHEHRAVVDDHGNRAQRVQLQVLALLVLALENIDLLVLILAPLNIQQRQNGPRVAIKVIPVYLQGTSLLGLWLVGYQYLVWQAIRTTATAIAIRLVLTADRSHLSVSQLLQ